MKSENLRCPDCGAKAITGSKRERSQLIPVRYDTDIKIINRWVGYPVTCPDCGALMKVVRECLTCAGSGKWKTAVSSADCECPDCIGASEILEEQP